LVKLKTQGVGSTYRLPRVASLCAVLIKEFRKITFYQTMEYDLNGKFIKETGEKDATKQIFIYHNQQHLGYTQSPLTGSPRRK